MTHFSPKFRRLGYGIALGALLISQTAPAAIAASSWSPTLLVNTESFQTIDDGDGTTNIELRFGDGQIEKIIYDVTNDRFSFTRGIRVGGNIVGTGSLTVNGNMSGGSLHVNGAATIGNNLSVTGSIRATTSITAKTVLSGNTLRVSNNAEVHGTLTASGNIRTEGRFTGTSLRVSGPAEVHGTLTASGNVLTDGDLTLNDDQTATDAVLTFGQPTTNQTLKYLNATGRFQFSRGLSVVGHMSGSSLNVDRNATVGGTLTATGSIRTKGNLSGATLNVDGAFNWRGISYNGPTSQSSNTFLKTDGAGNLSWASAAVGNGSGNIISLHPEYAGAIYFSSGSTYIGQMTLSGGTSALDNSYVWTSTNASTQDYWISVRVRLPDNFSTWDTVAPIQFRYKTGTSTAADNHLTVRMKDTAGADVALTGGGGLNNTAWTTGTITGPQAGGTWTPKGYFTIYVKLAAKANTNAAAGFINLNFETTTP
jgi:cytoskeletal protein CcmA (bactofilin family)